MIHLNKSVDGYTIGEIAKITGISRDRLRNYEKLGIIKPQRGIDNQYRFYTEQNIDRILTLELYRSAELELPAISKICSDSSIEDIVACLRENEASIEKKMKHLEILQRRTRGLIISCERIEKHLNKLCVAEMIPYEIMAEIDDYRSYQEYNKLFELREDDQPIVYKMQRRILFDENGIYSNKMAIIKPLDDMDNIARQRCVYTIIQDGEGHKNPLQDTFQKCIQFCMDNRLHPTGEVFIGMLLLHGRNGKLQSYLEIKGSIEK